MTTPLAVVVVSLVIRLFAAYLVTRQITVLLHETMVMVKRIAGGDLTDTIRVNRHDELGQVQSSI
ncbi:methyl-accepting chemotaxis protein [Pseudomonas sp. LTJR-52]|uniref:HAMP domain-containing protein n=1 Tax=Pseudomonas sp. LTJR-52 TaxID=2479392 RepID=UPI000EFBF021|nr:methyl-accepting chemotaxis protein [Pseudomonas sp. LTJR-52]